MTSPIGALLIAAWAASTAIYTRLPVPGIFVWNRFEVGRPMLGFLLPVSAVVVVAVLASLWRRDPVRDRDADLHRAYRTICQGVVVLMVGLHAVVLTGLTFGRHSTFLATMLPHVTPTLVGVVLMSVGNVLPRIRPNVVFGIRTPWLLAHRDHWSRVQRASGYATVLLGVVCLVTGLLVPPGVPVIAALSAGVVASVCVSAAAYIRVRRMPEAPCSPS